MSVLHKGLKTRVGEASLTTCANFILWLALATQRDMLAPSSVTILLQIQLADLTYYIARLVSLLLVLKEAPVALQPLCIFHLWFVGQSLKQTHSCGQLQTTGETGTIVNDPPMPSVWQWHCSAINNSPRPLPVFGLGYGEPLQMVSVRNSSVLFCSLTVPTHSKL